MREEMLDRLRREACARPEPLADQAPSHESHDSTLALDRARQQSRPTAHEASSVRRLEGVLQELDATMCSLTQTTIQTDPKASAVLPEIGCARAPGQGEAGERLIGTTVRGVDESGAAEAGPDKVGAHARHSLLESAAAAAAASAKATSSVLPGGKDAKEADQAIKMPRVKESKPCVESLSSTLSSAETPTRSHDEVSNSQDVPVCPSACLFLCTYRRWMHR